MELPSEPADDTAATLARSNLMSRAWARLTRGARQYRALDWTPAGSGLASAHADDRTQLHRRALTQALLCVPLVLATIAIYLLDNPSIAKLAAVTYAIPFVVVTWWMLDHQTPKRAQVGATFLIVGSVVFLGVLTYLDGFQPAYWMAVVILAACNVLSVRGTVRTAVSACTVLVAAGVALAVTEPFAATSLDTAAQIARRVSFVLAVMVFGVVARLVVDRRLREVHEQRETIEVQARDLADEVVQRKRAELELRRSLGTVITQATDGVITYDGQGVVLDANHAAGDILEVGSKQMCGRNLRDLVGVPDGVTSRAELVSRLTRPGGRLELSLGGSGTRTRVTEWGISARQVPGGVVFMAIVRDVTERKHLESELYHRANYDAATGLPKRPLFTKDLDDLARPEGHLAVAGVFAVGLDDLGVVQDAFGYDFGQEVLRVIGARLSGMMADRGTVGAFDRVGFLVAVRGRATQADLFALARRMQDVVSEPIELRGNRVAVTACVGVSMPIRQRREFSACATVNEAGAALSRARQFGRQTVQLHDDGMQQEARRTAELDHALRLALPGEEFRLVFQPVVSLHSGEVVSAEALLRWERPGVGMVSPAEFLPRLEVSGLIVAVGEWVIEEACRQLAAWHRRLRAAAPDARLPRVNVNLSAVQFASANLSSCLHSSVERHGLTPSDLVLEVTESTAFDPRFDAEQQLARFREQGYLVAIDDFGTGYSALNKIVHVNVDVVKLDKSYVDQITTDERDRALVTGILAVCRQLGLHTVAEGVETEEQHEMLRGMGCDRVQGFWVAKPGPSHVVLTPAAAYVPARRGELLRSA